MCLRNYAINRNIFSFDNAYMAEGIVCNIIIRYRMFFSVGFEWPSLELDTVTLPSRKIIICFLKTDVLRSNFFSESRFDIRERTGIAKAKFQLQWSFFSLPKSGAFSEAAEPDSQFSPLIYVKYCPKFCQTMAGLLLRPQMEITLGPFENTRLP